MGVCVCVLVSQGQEQCLEHPPQTLLEAPSGCPAGGRNEGLGFMDTRLD